MFISVCFVVAIAYGVDGSQSGCGILSSEPQRFKRGGSAHLGTIIPWHAGLYTKTKMPYMQLCGATLVSTTTVITAASCVWDNFRKSERPASEYAVAVGKIYRPWNDIQDTLAQTSDVAKISIPPRFHGDLTNYQDDLAVLKLADAVEVTSAVRPVCLSFNNLEEQHQGYGKIAHWHLTESNTGVKKERELKVLEIPSVPIQQCFSEVPSSFREFITSDKFCSYSSDPSQKLCRSGGGSGLAIPVTDEAVTRYYLRGIASTAPAQDDGYCSQIVLYTEISRHADFIKAHLD